MADRWAATSSDVTIFRKFDHSNIVSKRHKTAKIGVLGIAPKSRAKVCAQWRMSLSPPPGSLLATDRSKAVVLV